MKQKLLSFLSLIFLLISPLVKGQAPTLPDGVLFPDNISDADCFIPPPSFTWDIAKRNQSSITPATMRLQSYANLLVGDVTGDGVPEIITLNFLTNSYFSDAILIFNNDLTLYRSIPVPVSETYVTLPLALGDVNNDGIPEIIYGTGIRSITNPNLHYRLQAYRADGTLVWTSSHSYMQSYNDTYFHSTSINIADLDGDGNVEIFAGDRVFDGRTGNLLATLPTTPVLPSHVNMSTCGRGVQLLASSAVMSGYLSAIGDVDGDGIQELVCGNTTYKININSRTNPALNTVTVVGQIDMVDGYTSLADIDGDGKVDVVVVGRPTRGDDSQMYVWSGVGTSANKIGQTVLGSSYKLLPGDPQYVPAYANLYGTNGSRPFIGDIDGDGKPEIAYTSYALLGIFSYNSATNQFVRRFRTGTTDTSAATTLSLFDFNQDGRSELVYRDETDLRIMQFSDNGSGGFNCTETTFPCLSGTHTEYPTIADIDGDGHAEIIVSGADPLDKPHGTGAPNENIRVMVFGSPSNSWAPARRVWNQHAYNAINVNKDLTIPAKPINPPTVFAGEDGILGTADDVKPFNNFLQQQTTLSKHGTPLRLAPNAQIVNTPVFSYDEANDEMNISLQVKNAGDEIFQNPFYITIYKDNVGGTPKKTFTYPARIAIGETIDLALTIPDFVRDWTPYHFLVIKINDHGDGKDDQEVCDSSKGQYRYYGIIPTQQDVCLGKAVTINCSFVLPGGTNTYQWQSSPNDFTWTDIPGATSNTYSPNDKKRSRIYYRVVVQDGIETINSVSSFLRVRSCQIPVNHNISVMEY